MKRITAIVLLSLSVLAGSTAALAQQRALEVTVPFDFTVGDTSLPAGAYFITSSAVGIMSFQSETKRNSVWTTTVQGHEGDNGKSRLVFERYANRYFLHKIICPTVTAMNVHLPTSPTEKRLRREESSLEREQVALLVTH